MLPEHGYSFSRTPLWAGIAMLPLTAGILLAGPISGILSDKYGSRPFATAGMIGSVIAFILLSLLPINFIYWQFALILLFMGIAMGCFAAPNRAGVMNSLPPEDRGSGGGMNATFQNSAQVLSIGIFFTLMIAGLAANLPKALASGLISHGVPQSVALSVSHLPPVSVLFAAFLGYSPIKELISPKVFKSISPHNQAILTGHSFFPRLIAAPFAHGLTEAFIFAIIACAIAAAASWFRGKKYVHGSID
ncbi:MAG: MFS transporter [Candidatus Saccharibacteria bacterium]